MKSWRISPAVTILLGFVLEAKSQPEIGICGRNLGRVIKATPISWSSVSINCSAKYPVEFVDDNGSHSESERLESRMEESSVEYSINEDFQIKTKSEFKTQSKVLLPDTSKNVTICCKSVENPCLQQSVHISRSSTSPVSAPTQSKKMIDQPDSSGPPKSKGCVMLISDEEKCEGCSKVVTLKNFRFFVAFCGGRTSINSEIDCPTGNVFFFGIPPNDQPEIYFGLKDVNPDSTIFMEPFHEEQLLNDYLNVTCLSYDFFNVKSIKFELEFKNNSKLELEATETLKTDKNVHSLTQRILLHDETIDKIRCCSEDQRLRTCTPNSAHRTVVVQSHTSNENESSLIRMMDIILIGSSIGGVVVLILVICVVVQVIKRRRRKNVLSHVTIANVAIKEIRGDSLAGRGSVGIAVDNCSDCFNANLEVPRDRLIFNEGDVAKSKSSLVTIKGRMRLGEGQKTQVKVILRTVKANSEFWVYTSLLSEIKILAFLGQHENVAGLLASCTVNIREKEIFAAIEFCGKGNLRKVLLKSKSSFRASESNLKPIYSNASEVSAEEILTPGKLLRWSRDICRGMIHLGEKEVIHRQLEVRNILITMNNVAKITEFGMARVLLEGSRYVEKQQMAISWRYTAIESLKEKYFSVKSDVWGFGVTLFEMFSLGETPYAKTSWSPHFLERLEGGLRLSKPKHATDQIFDLMKNCWQEQPGRRPSFSNIHDHIQEILSKVPSVTAV